VTVYAGIATCHGAQRAAESKAEEVAPLHVRVRCLPAVEHHGHFDLAQIGANARSATEDSTTIAYIGEVEPHANQFATPILEEAGIAQLPNMSGPSAIHKLFKAIRTNDSSGSLRESLHEELSGG
jgi:hypothetical protein